MSNLEEMEEDELLLSGKKPYKRARLGSDQEGEQVLIEKGEERKTDDKNGQA